MIGLRRRRMPTTRRLIAAVVVLAGFVGLVVLSQAQLRESADEARLAEFPHVRIGYVPYWDEHRALDVVRQHPTLFNEISPVWYSLDSSGHVVPADDEHTEIDPETVRDLQERGIRVVPTVTNLRNGEWNPALVRSMLHRPEVMRTHVRELVDLAVEKEYDGIDIDYESLQGSDREPYTRFVQELGEALRAEGKTLATAVHPKTSDEGDDGRNLAQDYRAIGAAVDQVRVMAYDYSWDTSEPGPVAPAQWVEDVIAWTVTQIPPDKVVLGIDLMGYDWGEGPGVTLDYGGALQTAHEHDATIQREPDGTPWFTYDDALGARHEVWFEDAESASTKLELVAEYDLAGAFFWRLGGEDPTLWQSIAPE